MQVLRSSLVGPGPVSYVDQELDGAIWVGVPAVRYGLTISRYHQCQIKDRGLPTPTDVFWGVIFRSHQNHV